MNSSKMMKKIQKKKKKKKKKKKGFTAGKCAKKPCSRLIDQFKCLCISSQGHGLQGPEP